MSRFSWHKWDTRWLSVLLPPSWGEEGPDTDRGANCAAPSDRADCDPYFCISRPWTALIMTANLSSSVSAVCRPVMIYWTVVINVTVSPSVHLSAACSAVFMWWWVSAGRVSNHSQSHFTTDGQLVSPSWRRAPSVTGCNQTSCGFVMGRPPCREDGSVRVTLQLTVTQSWLWAPSGGSWPDFCSSMHSWGPLRHGAFSLARGRCCPVTNRSQALSVLAIYIMYTFLGIYIMWVSESI
jgi:hypothetical protein